MLKDISLILADSRYSFVPLLANRQTMYYIWTDESDSTGKYYANFYGGILIQSEYYEEVLLRLSNVVKDVGLEAEEIKWQKVNEYTEERYKRIIDVLFDLLGEGKAKIRIFFRHRQFEPFGLSNEQRRKEYPKLYYQAKFT